MTLVSAGTPVASRIRSGGGSGGDHRFGVLSTTGGRGNAELAREETGIRVVDREDLVHLVRPPALGGRQQRADRPLEVMKLRDSMYTSRLS